MSEALELLGQDIVARAPGVLWCSRLPPWPLALGPLSSADSLQPLARGSYWELIKKCCAQVFPSTKVPNPTVT